MAVLAPVHTRRHPEETTLYEVVRDNLATLYAAVDEGALPIALTACMSDADFRGQTDAGATDGKASMLHRAMAQVTSRAPTDPRADDAWRAWVKRTR